MILFHFAWDMRTYWPRPIFQFTHSLWLLGGGLIGGTFLFLSGISTILTMRFSSRRKIALNGLKVIFCALIVSGVTFYVIPESPIYFGILHCIGISLLVAASISGHPKTTLLFAAITILLGIVTEFFEGSTLWLVWAGMVFPGYSSSDFFPLFPWSGVLFLGMYLSPIIYKPELEPKPLGAPPLLLFIGRHSLMICLLHQPILLGIVKEIGMFA